jgi:hypothetical protein
MLRLRVSDLDQWVRYAEPEREEWEVPLEDFLRYMRREEEANENMMAGRAFHILMERALAGDDLQNEDVEGFRFRFADDLPPVCIPPIREESCEKVYATPSGPVLLRGRVDGREGIEVVDFKLTSGQFNAERYAASLQWRAYLDMTGGLRFRYVVFQGKRTDRETFVFAIHELVFWSYPEMAADVALRAGELAAFCRSHVPELVEAS